MLIDKEWHEREYSSLEVTMLGLVINPEYSWLGASPDGVVHDPGCTDPNGLLEINCPYNYHDSTSFQAAAQKEFVAGWKRVSLFKENNIIIIIKCKDRCCLL